MTRNLVPEALNSSEAPSEPGLTAQTPRRRWMRRLGTAFVVLGITFFAYGACVYFWRDPVTDLYARWKQHELAGQLDAIFSEYRPALDPPAVVETNEDGGTGTEATTPPPSTEEADSAALAATTRSAAEKMFAGLEPGQALGRIVIPKLGIDPVFVNGTRWGADLSRGPGRYEQTSLPGLGEVTAIAGHRTTFGAPFRHIDRLAAGDTITLELPYGTFRYTVVRHKIVNNDDWSIIRAPGYDALVLSACHPLYSASHRWVVFARLAEVETPRGESYAVQ